MSRLTRVRKWFGGAKDQGFTLVELAVSLGILSMVMTMAFSVLISTQNLSGVLSWQSSSNTELRQLIDGVFADIETARPALGCDSNNDGKADTTSYNSSTCAPKYSVERNDPVLLVAAPNRICYYTNRLSARQSTTAASNPAYTAACLAVVGGDMRLETWAVASDGNWNATIVDGSRAPSKIRVLSKVDPTAATDGFFEYYGSAEPTVKLGSKVTSPPSVAVTVGTDIVSTLGPADQKAVTSVVMKARMRLATTGNQSTRTRDIVYRITLRAARYSSERCGLGNVDAGTTCS